MAVEVGEEAVGAEGGQAAEDTAEQEVGGGLEAGGGAAAWRVVPGLVIRPAAMALRRVVSLMLASRAVVAMEWPSSSRSWHCADVSTLSTTAPRTTRSW